VRSCQYGLALQSREGILKMRNFADQRARCISYAATAKERSAHEHESVIAIRAPGVDELLTGSQTEVVTPGIVLLLCNR
jgi:hypothetical protein